MNTRRNVTRRLKEETANAGVPPNGDQVPPLKEDVNDDQAPVHTPSTDGAIRAALFKMVQAIITQAQASTIQAQSRRPKIIGRLYPEQTNKLLPCLPV